ncbi:MAG: TldD/PmbA family protein, partial [Actinobacteria bacterium]|nr:TldD/PmbA family protein [Actinomycetota bacterium]
MRVEVPDLQAIADRIVAQAKPGEQIEAYVGRGGETSVRVYEGELEHFVSAQSAGVGIRVIKDGRTGVAYAGTLDESAISEVLADARDNVQFGNPDEFAGLATPDGVEPVPQKFWDEALANYPTDQKVALTKDLEQRALAADSRVRTESANYDDGWDESAFATTTGIRISGRSNGCYVSVVTLADDGDETQTGFGFSVGDSPNDFNLDKAAREAADRATRLLGATKPASKRTTIVLDPYVTSQFISILSSAFSGENVSKGRSIFADRLNEQVAVPSFTLVDDPTNKLAYTSTDIDGEGLAARRNVLIE